MDAVRLQPISWTIVQNAHRETEVLIFYGGKLMKPKSVGICTGSMVKQRMIH